MPPYVQIQYVAVALQDVLGQLLNLNWLVTAVPKTVTRQALTMELSGLVETPALRDPKRGVRPALLSGVIVSGVARCHLKHEVARLALLGDDVGVAA